MEERATKKVEAALEHPPEHNLLVGRDERDVGGGRSTPLDQGLRRKNSLLNKSFEIIFGGIASLEILEVCRKCVSRDGRLGRGFVLPGTGSVGGSHGENGSGSSLECESEKSSKRK